LAARLQAGFRARSGVEESHLFKQLFLWIAFAGIAGAASAQSYNAFLPVDQISGIDVLNSGLSYTVTVGAAPSYTVGGITYDIQDVFGFWVLNGSGVVDATLSPSDDWMVRQHDSAAGWMTPPPQGLTAGESYTFTFDSIDPATVEDFGFHVRLGGSNGETLHIREAGGSPPAPGVPGPAAVAPFLTGLISLRSRKRKN
jgi:hypothetical protein